MDMYLVIGGVVVVLAVMLWVYMVPQWVDNNSRAIEALRELNRKYHDAVSPLPPIQATFKHEASSKREFDRLDMDRFLTESLLAHEKWFDRDIRERHRRHILFTEYAAEVQAHRDFMFGPHAAERAIPKFLKSLELKRFDAQILPAPVRQADVRAVCTYTSPQGRNHYYDFRALNYEELVAAIVHARELRESRATTQTLRQRERELMSNRLRVDILRRDGGRCQMCGASAADGATLHVDHIIPVSHGGRTLPSNLQILCQECNLGKGARFVG